MGSAAAAGAGRGGNRQRLKLSGSGIENKGSKGGATKREFMPQFASRRVGKAIPCLGSIRRPSVAGVQGQFEPRSTRRGLQFVGSPRGGDERRDAQADYNQPEPILRAAAAFATSSPSRAHQPLRVLRVLRGEILRNPALWPSRPDRAKLCRMTLASFDDYRAAARRRLPRVLFDYIDGGAYAEHTLARNVERSAGHQRCTSG